MPLMTAPTTRRQTWQCNYLSRLVVPRRAWNAARQLWRKQNQCHCAHSANRGTKHKRPDENHTHVHTQRETRTQHAATKGLQQPRPSCSHPLPPPRSLFLRERHGRIALSLCTASSQLEATDLVLEMRVAVAVRQAVLPVKPALQARHRWRGWHLRACDSHVWQLLVRVHDVLAPLLRAAGFRLTTAPQHCPARRQRPRVVLWRRTAAVVADGTSASGERWGRRLLCKRCR